MKKICWLASLALVLALLSQSIPGQAQETTTVPLYIQSGEQTWVWAGTELVETELTYCEGIHGLHAPNTSGLYVRTVVEQAWLEAEREPFGGGIETPINFMLCDLITQAEPKIIADQPENYAIKEDGHAENSVVRGVPAWSPDGTQLAWTELRASGSDLFLVMYDVASDSLIDVADNIPSSSLATGGPVAVYWSDYGIVAITATFDSDLNATPTFILTDPVDGQQASYVYTPLAPDSTGFSNSSGNIPEVQRFFTSSGMVVVYSNGAWQILNWNDGSQTEFTGQLAMVSAGNPDGLQAHLSIDTEQIYHWTIVSPDGESQELSPNQNGAVQFALSPDGNSVAFGSANGLTIWNYAAKTQDELIITSAEPLTLVWSPLIWRIVE